jgi:hypothetical protein
MPNDLYFYQEAKATLNKINKGELWKLIILRLNNSQGAK